MALVIEGVRAREQPSTAERAPPFDDGVGGAEGAKIGEQRHHIPIPHRQHVAVDNRQGESRPLKQGAGVAHVEEGRHSRTDTAVHLEFRIGEAVAEFLKRLAAEHGGEKQPVRPQGGADLGESARKIIHPLQHQCAQHEIETRRPERQRLLVADDLQPRRRQQTTARDVTMDERAHALSVAQELGQTIVRASKIENVGERASDVPQSFAETVAGGVEQKGAFAVRRADRVAPPTQQATVKDDDRISGHALPARSWTQPAPDNQNHDMVTVSFGSLDDVIVGHARVAARTPMIGWTALVGAATKALDVVLPPLCLGCNDVVNEQQTLCPSCWSAIRFVSPPFCDFCGAPHAVDVAPNMICASCAAARPAFARARSVFVYDRHSRGLILKFKYADRTDAVPTFATWMVRAGADLIDDAEAIVPVPLHWTRLMMRKYNQAALLAQAIARISGKPYAPTVLKRQRRTPPLKDANPSARRRIVGGVFAITPALRHQVAERRVLLIDDVLTTGATVGACARALSRAGARAVDVLTLARAMRDGR